MIQHNCKNLKFNKNKNQKRSTKRNNQIKLKKINKMHKIINRRYK